MERQTVMAGGNAAPTGETPASGEETPGRKVTLEKSPQAPEEGSAAQPDEERASKEPNQNKTDWETPPNAVKQPGPNPTAPYGTSSAYQNGGYCAPGQGPSAPPPPYGRQPYGQPYYPPNQGAGGQPPRPPVPRQPGGYGTTPPAGGQAAKQRTSGAAIFALVSSIACLVFLLLLFLFQIAMSSQVSHLKRDLREANRTIAHLQKQLEGGGDSAGTPMEDLERRVDELFAANELLQYGITDSLYVVDSGFHFDSGAPWAEVNVMAQPDLEDGYTGGGKFNLPEYQITHIYEEMGDLIVGLLDDELGGKYDLDSLKIDFYYNGYDVGTYYSGSFIEIN